MNNHVKIVKAERHHLYEIAVFLHHSWKSEYRQIVSDDFLDSMSIEERHNELLKRFDKGLSEFLIMMDGNQLVGAVVFGKSFTVGYEDDGEISAIYLHAKYIGKGYGHRLFAKTERLLRDKGYHNLVMDLLADNMRALSFYLKHGYKKVADRTIRLGEKEYPLAVLRKMNDLTQNIDKLHTTPMGAERIKRNLNLQTDDVVLWCKKAVKQADIMIGQGKNWYVYGNGNVITINVHSYTIITAHKINAKVRVMRVSDHECLPEFLYQAIYIPEGEKLPPRSIINDPEIFVYIKDFGTQQGDLGVVAEENGQIIGAAWTRIIPAYGRIDSETPELAISISPEFRSYGIGTQLMKKMFDVLWKNGYKQTSLSVQKNNPAVRFYQRLGYKTTDERLDHAGHEDYLMIKKLAENEKEIEIVEDDKNPNSI